MNSEKTKSQFDKDIQSSNISCLDELHKLGELYKTGILTEEEFNNKKKELLKNN